MLKLHIKSMNTHIKYSTNSLPVSDEMNGILRHDSAVQGYTGPGSTWTNEMNFVMNHALGARSITRSTCWPHCITYTPVSVTAIRWLVQYHYSADLKTH